MVSEPGTLDRIRMDVAIWREAAAIDGDGISLLRLLLVEPGFQLALALRLQQALSGIPIIGAGLLPLLRYATTLVFACHISPAARIGGGLYLPHPVGIVVGQNCVLGDNVTLYQHVTIGQRRHGDPAQPVVGDRCRLYSGATVLGGISLGAGAQIGAKALVLHDIPADHIAMGAPARSFPAPGRQLP